MAIQTPYLPDTYAGDGIANAYPVTFPYQFYSDLVVQAVNVTSGVVTTLIYGTDYTVTPTTNSPASTGVVTTTVPVAVGVDLVVTRNVPATQLTHWVPNDPNPTAATENGFDKLTMLVQALQYGFGRSWYLPVTGVDGSSYFDARGNRGGNLGAPINPGDAVTLSYMVGYITSLITTGSATSPLDFEFVGDGSTTSFSMPGATLPVTTGYWVTLDGVTQRPTSDYTVTLSGIPQMVFATAPPVNVLIGVRVLGYAQPITTGIDGSAITSGLINTARLGTGAASASTFLRGDRTWNNVLLGPAGAVVVPGNAVVVAEFQNAGQAAVRVSGAAGGQSGYWFGAGGASTPFSAAWIYDDTLGAVSFYGAAGSLHQFYANGTVNLGSGTLYLSGGNVGIGTTTPTTALTVNGTVNAALFTGNASGALITSGQVQPQYLGSNAPGPSLFLRGDGLWAAVSGGGGGGSTLTTTTATFVVAAVSSSQTIAVASVTSLSVGAYIYVSDATHTIIGQITGIAALNLTVVTNSITAGSAGQTMASGATVGQAAQPGNNSVQATDAGVTPTSTSTFAFTGQTSAVPATGYTVDLYIASVAAGTSTLKGYVKSGTLPLTSLGGQAVAPTQGGIAYLPTGNTWSLLAPSGLYKVLQQDGSTGLSWGLLTAANISTNSLIPGNLATSNAGTAGYVLTYSSSLQFTWIPNPGIPAGGNAGQFVRGDATLTNVIQVQSGSGYIGVQSNTGALTARFTPSANALTFTQDTVANGVNDKNTYAVFVNCLVASSGAPTQIDTAPTYPNTPIETFYSGGVGRFGSGVRCDFAGYYARMTTINAPATTVALDIQNGSYYRFTGFANNVTFTLTDSGVFLPTPIVGNPYSAEMTLEINAPGAFTITWPGNITWANGASAPTLSTTGTNIIRLIRRQGQTQWIGYVDGVSSGSYTDSNAINAIMSASRLLNSSSIGWSVVTGSSGTATPSISALGVVGSMIANATIAVGKLSATGTPSSTTFLRGDNTWATVPGGQSAIQVQLNGSNFGTAGAAYVLNFAGFTTSGSAPNLTINAPTAGSSPLTTKGDLFGYSTTTARVPVGADGFILTADSTQALGVKWAAAPGGAFSPSTAYTWTAGQAFNAANTHGAAVLHTVVFPSQFTSGTATTGFIGTGSAVDGSLGTRTPFYAHVDNHAPASATLATDYASQVNVGTFWHAVYNPGQLMSSLRNVVDGRGNFTNPAPGSASFHLAFTSEIYTRQVNKTNGNGTVDSIWFVATSPNISYSGTPDGQGITHSFGAGTVRIGELNYGNLWADFGLQETRGFARGVLGLEFFPDALPGAVTGAGATNKFDATYAWAIGCAGAGSNGQAPRNWIGGLIDQNAIVPNGYALRIWGSNGTFTGNNGTQNAATNAPAALIKMSGTAKTGIDFAGSANDSTILTATNTGAPVISMVDGQSIKLGTAFWIRASTTHLQYSTNGTTWTNIV